MTQLWVRPMTQEKQQQKAGGRAALERIARLTAVAAGVAVLVVLLMAAVNPQAVNSQTVDPEDKYSLKSPSGIAAWWLQRRQ